MSTDTYTALTKVPEGDAPLVFAFHGTGGDEQQFFGLAQELLPGAGVVSPRGDVSEMGAARFFRRTGEGVYDMNDLTRATDKMAGFVEAWKAKHPGRPVFGFGYSNGANILASTMMARPDLFDRIALLHPLIPWSPDPAQGLAGKQVLVTAGRNDPIGPWPLTERLIKWVEAQGATVSTVVHAGGHELRAEEIDALRPFFEHTSVPLNA
ncbi:esterase (plasmid) [Roseobacter denitrificans]|uniref:RC150 n=1 Tax=Roseobacter denitrificans (strain ATCC 33942 / OCh 114) TaxID=375451 RepID=Q07GK4_ROSDO|nr:alpha/beta hydrolase [Roseobacter denitrificans]ABI93395.1 RC150 [Roseobacter denitrificans OCh 114]AVL51242.1 esterase [Roseobacter denitrificans]SFG47721.1 phospholipase/carboxylesterase [Roseobacter denitrificans OCh 114]